MKAAREMFTADNLPTREGAIDQLRAFEMTSQVPEASKMNPDGLIDTRFVRKALENTGGCQRGRFHVEPGACTTLILLFAG